MWVWYSSAHYMPLDILYVIYAVELVAIQPFKHHINLSNSPPDLPFQVLPLHSSWSQDTLYWKYFPAGRLEVVD